MKRFFTNLAALVLGLFLGGFCSYALADSVAATQGRWARCVVTQSAPELAFPLTAEITTMYSAACSAAGGYWHSYQGCTSLPNGAGAVFGCFNGITNNRCPDSSYSLDMATRICSRPDCVAPAVRLPDGQCAVIACPVGQFSSGYYLGSAPGGACAPNGCDVSFTGSYPAGRDAQGRLYSQGSYSYAGGNQGSCTPGQNGAVAAPATSSNTLTSTKPGPNGCGAGDGVITSSSGKVACVPQGTEGSIPAVNEKTSKTETFSDGSTKTTTTTEVCTGEGACSSTTTITIGAASGGGAGIAGTPGTSTTGVESGTDADGDGEVDSKGDCDPKSQMCGEPGHGDLYAKKGKTMQSAFTTFSNGLKASPMGQAATGFFSVSIPSGACPAMAADVAYLGVTVNLADHICTTTAIEMMQMAGAVLLVLATFVAFRWAFL